MASERLQPGCQLPEDLVSILDGLGKAETDARQLVEGLTDAQLNWQAATRKTWSIAQCLDHLAKTKYLLYGGYAVCGAQNSSWHTDSVGAQFEQVGSNANSSSQWMQQRARNSKKVIPADFRTVEEVLAAFCASHQEMPL